MALTDKTDSRRRFMDIIMLLLFDSYQKRNSTVILVVDIWISDIINILLLSDAVNKAYQYSSITSVTLLDCWTIPWVIILTWIFLGTRYSIWQFFGAALCILGLVLVLLSDAGVGGGGDIFFPQFRYDFPLLFFFYFLGDYIMFILKYSH